ncbi:MAG: FAD-binding oxidoreductase [Salinarimonadaceae bacterium]|nr:MAG: FAD-binding oxidoreductase [Salinarimonadaceae bacterium]
MPERVAVLGAGVVGSATAWFLAKRGRGQVLLFDSGAVGAGSTARSVGGIRSIFAHRLEMELSRFSLAAFRELAAEHPRAAFTGCGYLLLAADPERARRQDAVIDMARDLGVQVDDVAPADLDRIIPGVSHEGIVRALHSPQDGYIAEPEAAARAYADRAVATGRVSMFEHTPVRHVMPRHGGGFEIDTAGGPIGVDAIVIALNAFAGPILEGLGHRLASYPYPRHVFAVDPAPERMASGMPITVFQDGDLMLRHDGGRITCIVGTAQASSDTIPDISAELPVFRERIAQRLDLSRATVSHAWSGLRALTPDRRALVGALPGHPGAWCAMGFSGHGFMHAPAIGLALSEMVMDGECRSFDMAELRPDRFGEAAQAPPVLTAHHH